MRKFFITLFQIIIFILFLPFYFLFKTIESLLKSELTKKILPFIAFAFKWVFGIGALSSLFFYIVYKINPFLQSHSNPQFLIRISDNVFLLRTSLFDLFLRVAPLMVTIVMATSSVMVNKYTSSYFYLTFRDRKIRAIIHFYVWFIVFHLLSVAMTPEQGWLDTQKYYAHYFYLFSIDTLFCFITFGYSVYTAIRVFLFTQPDKLASTIRSQIERKIKRLSKFATLSSAKENKYKSYKDDVLELIGMFINLTVTAVKAKDHKVITSNINSIGQNVWVSIVENALTPNEAQAQILQGTGAQIRRLVGHYNRDKKIENFVSRSEELRRDLYDRLILVYKDIFESAFSSKEFFVCDKIIESIKNMREAEPWNTKVYEEIFEVTLSYNYTGYTRKYCKEISGAVVAILASQSDPNYDSYFELIKKTIDHKQDSILSTTLSGIKGFFDTEQDDSNKADICELIKHSCIYSLQKKRMDCFAAQIRFLVTNQIPFDLVNNTFSDFLPPPPPIQSMIREFAAIANALHKKKQKQEKCFYI